MTELKWPQQVIDLAVNTPDPGTNYHLFVAGTDEGAQTLKPRSQTTARELMREVGSVLRMSEAEAANLGDLPEDPEEDQTMIINMGPQHPSTHGVLRLMLELQGETVLRCKPIIGYLHTGMEKDRRATDVHAGRDKCHAHGLPEPAQQRAGVLDGHRKLLGIDGDIPERAIWIRMLLSELNRMSSHLLFMATNGMDLGALCR